MDFIKKNYEKIILSIVLLGLVGVAGFLPVVIANDQDQMSREAGNLINPTIKPLPDLDLSRQEAVLARIKQNAPFDFSTSNRLFNPVTWQKDKDGHLIKIVNGNEVGGGAAVVTKITPLYFEISLDQVITNEVQPRYKLAVANQASDIPGLRRPQSRYISLGQKTSEFELISVKGPAANPTELDLVLTNGQTAVVAPNSPYRRTDGYSADLKYAPKNMTGTDLGANLRVGAILNFAGDQYNIVAIDQNDVVLLAQSNQKKFVLPYTQ
ncbi:MAG: hypothetical protein ACLQSR_15765 [Limisphaerales bacterium]